MYEVWGEGGGTHTMGGGGGGATRDTAPYIDDVSLIVSDRVRASVRVPCAVSDTFGHGSSDSTCCDCVI